MQAQCKNSCKFCFLVEQARLLSPQAKCDVGFAAFCHSLSFVPLSLILVLSVFGPKVLLSVSVTLLHLNTYGVLWLNAISGCHSKKH